MSMSQERYSNSVGQTVLEFNNTKVAQKDESKTFTVSVVRWCSKNWRRILSEFFCTTLLVIFGCMSCIPVHGSPEASVMHSAFGFGLAGSIIIQIFGHISGAYINPAVALAATIWGNNSLAVGIAYTIVQCLGGILGYGILMCLSPIDLTIDAICVPKQHPEINGLQIAGVELLMTAALVFVCCSLWDPANQHLQDSAPLKFGLTVAGLSLAGGNLTGSMLNPARTLGPTLWNGVWTYHWAYWAGPYTGSMIAVLIYKSIFLQHSPR